MIDDIIVICAFRYALGRKTYVVSEVVSYILQNWNDFSNKTQKLFQEEIQKAILDNKSGMPIDTTEWLKILYLDSPNV